MGLELCIATCASLTATGRLQVEVRVALIASRLYEPERIPTLLARPEVRNLGSLSPRPNIGRHLMHVSRRARGTFLVGADGDTFWHVQCPFGPRASGYLASVSSAHDAAPVVLFFASARITRCPLTM